MAKKRNGLRTLGIVILVLIVLGLVGGFVVLPWVRMQTMAIPISDGLAAVQRGDADALKKCFTEDATLEIPRLGSSISAVGVINDTAVELKKNPPKGDHLEFSGLQNVHEVQPGRWAAEFTITATPANEDMPYQNMKAKTDWKIELERTGFISWKIKHIVVPDDVAAMMYEAMMQSGAPQFNL